MAATLKSQINSPHSLHSRLGNLLQTSQWSDCTFIVGEGDSKQVSFPPTSILDVCFLKLTFFIFMLPLGIPSSSGPPCYMQPCFWSYVLWTISWKKCYINSWFRSKSFSNSVTVSIPFSKKIPILLCFYCQYNDKMFLPGMFTLTMFSLPVLKKLVMSCMLPKSIWFQTYLKCVICIWNETCKQKMLLLCMNMLNCWRKRPYMNLVYWYVETSLYAFYAVFFFLRW